MAERLVTLMGSGAGAAEEAVDVLRKSGEKVGLLKVRLFRPFAAEAFLSAIPSSMKSIAVLDRSLGEPLYQDVLTGYMERLASNAATGIPRIIGGRYGLSSRESTPAMVKAVFDELKKSQPKNHFTVGIQGDVTHTNLEYDADFSTEDPRTVRALFYGLGSDGTVGANKNSIKIMGREQAISREGTSGMTRGKRAPLANRIRDLAPSPFDRPS
jgi:pyruvate-ferredoxin/flavodoxin oxidoreductase